MGRVPVKSSEQKTQLPTCPEGAPHGGRHSCPRAPPTETSVWPHPPRRAGAPAMPVRRLSRQHTQVNSGGPEQARTAGRAGMTHSPALDRPRRPTHGTKDQPSGWTGLLARGLRAVLDANRESLAKARGRVPGGPPAPGGLGTLLVRSQGLEGRPGPLPPTGPRPERVVWPAGGAPPAACASPTVWASRHPVPPRGAACGQHGGLALPPAGGANQQAAARARETTSQGAQGGTRRRRVPAWGGRPIGCSRVTNTGRPCHCPRVP